MKRLLKYTASIAVAAAGVAVSVQDFVNELGPLPYCNELEVTRVAERTVQVKALTTVPTGAKIDQIDYLFGDGATVSVTNGLQIAHTFAPDYKEPVAKTVIQAAVWAKVDGQRLERPVLSQLCTKYIKVNP